MNIPINVNVVREKLIDLGWTQAELAEDAGLSKRAVEGILSRGTAALESLHRIAHSLELDVGAIRYMPASEPSSAMETAAPANPEITRTGRQFQLPSILPDFISRESEVREILDGLGQNQHCVALSALRGMGGIGKTTIAVQVAHMVKDRFPDAQLFIDLQGVSERPMTTVEVMTRFIRDLSGEIPHLPDSEAELLPIYRSVLAGKRVLLVLDNVKDEVQAQNLIAGDRSAFILTSRNALALDGIKSVQIDVLSHDNSLIMLRGIVGTKGSDNELRSVAKLCDNLPLALRVAGDFLRLKDDWNVARYIQALEKERLRWLKVGDAKEKDVDYVLKLSSAQLVRDNVELALRWHFLADWPADFAADAAAAAWNMDSDEDDVLEDLSELVDRSMLLFDKSTFRYRLHDLMKPIAAGLFA